MFRYLIILVIGVAILYFLFEFSLEMSFVVILLALIAGQLIEK